MVSALDIFLDLPAFQLAIFFLFWSLPLGAILGKIKVWRLWKGRDDAYGWARALQMLNGVKVLRLPGPTLFKGEPCLYLPNHRSWADFYLDVIHTEGHAQMLSRMMVAFAFPTFMLAVHWMKAAIVFQRGKKFDIEEFNSMIERKMHESPCEGLIVYAEGHRSTKRDSLPLKFGMVRFAYSRKLPVQIIVAANKEAVIAEKKCSAHFGQQVLVGYAPVIRSTDFPTWEGFRDRVTEVWNQEWQRVATADWATAHPLPLPDLEARFYPLATRLALLGLTLVEIFMMVFLVRWFFRFWASLAAGSVFGASVTALVVVWAGISLKRAFKPTFYVWRTPAFAAVSSGSGDKAPTQIEPADESAPLFTEDDVQANGSGTKA